MIKNNIASNPYDYEKYDEDKEISSLSSSLLDISNISIKIIGKENQSEEKGRDRRCGDMDPAKSGIRNYVNKDNYI